MLVREVLAKNKTVIMPQPLYSPDLAPADFYLFPKLKAPMKVFYYDWGDKWKIETGALGDTKKYVSEAFRRLEKNAGISVLYISIPLVRTLRVNKKKIDMKSF